MAAMPLLKLGGASRLKFAVMYFLADDRGF